MLALGWTAAILAAVPMRDEPLVAATLVLEKPAILLGEATYLRFRVKNLTQHDLRIEFGGDGRNKLGRPMSFEIVVTGADGKRVFQPDAGLDFGGMGGLSPFPKLGSYDYVLFLPHWARFDAPGRYEIVARRPLTLEFPKNEDADARPKSLRTSAEARATLVVLPPDREAMGKLIEALARKLIDRHDNDAEIRLGAMRDERIVPHYAFLAKRADAESRRIAAAGLANYASDEAFEALRGLAGTTAIDLVLFAGPGVNLDADAIVRQRALYALMACRHPKARAFAWTLASDPHPAVRRSVALEAAAFPDDPTARATLDRLANDADESVRKEVQRVRAR